MENRLSRKFGSEGFTLAEMAIVVLIGSILLTMGVKILLSQLDNASYSDTKSKQERIKTALIGYLRSNGRMPCPDIAAIPTGASPLICTATPAAGYGVVPWTALNLSRDDVLDGWGNFFTYRVANSKPSGKDWTTKTTLGTSFDVRELTTQTPAINIGTSTGLSDITTIAVAVIYSHGKNGYGSVTTKGNVLAAPPAANVDERTNNNPLTNPSAFVIRPYTDVQASPGGPFDDMVTYLTPQDLLQPLINEGTLRTCYGYCSSTVSATCTIGGGTCTCTAAGVLGTPVLPCTVCGNCIAGSTGSGCQIPPGTIIPIGVSPITCP